MPLRKDWLTVLPFVQFNSFCGQRLGGSAMRLWPRRRQWQQLFTSPLSVFEFRCGQLTSRIKSLFFKSTEHKHRWGILVCWSCLKLQSHLYTLQPSSISFSFFCIILLCSYKAIFPKWEVNSSPSLKPAAQWRASQFCKSKFIQTEFCAKQKVQLNSRAEAHVSRCT